MAQTVEIIPFPIAQIRAFLSPPCEQFVDATQPAGDRGSLAGQVHLRQIEISAQLLPLRVGLPAEASLTPLGLHGFFPFALLIDGHPTFLFCQVPLLATHFPRLPLDPPEVSAPPAPSPDHNPPTQSHTAH